MEERRSHTVFSLAIDCALFLVIFTLDRLSKSFAIDMLQDRSSVDLLRWGGIEGYLTFATNTGAAWGMFQDMSLLLSIVRIAFLVILFLLYLKGSFDRVIQIGLIMIMSGALSNLIDNAMYGHVIDMIHFRFWGYDYPIFNIADSAITLGALTCMYSSFKQSSSS